jgi:hypothetical protein
MNPDPSQPQNAVVEELRTEIRGLRLLLNLSLLAGLMIAGALSIFFLREVILVRRQSSDQLRFVAEYEKWREDTQRAFQAFAKTNADFAPILNKYFSTNAAPAKAGPPGAAAP